MLYTASADSGAPRHGCSQHLAAASAPKKNMKKIQKREAPAHWTHGTPAHRKWIKMTKQGPSRTHVFDCSTPPLQGESLLEPSVPDLVVQSRISKGQPVAMECYSITASRARKSEIHGNRFQKSIKRLKTRPNGPIRPNGLMCYSIALSRCRWCRPDRASPLSSPRKSLRGVVLRLCCRSPSPKHQRSAEASSSRQRHPAKGLLPHVLMDAHQ